MNFPKLAIASPLASSSQRDFVSGVALTATRQSSVTPTQGTSGGGFGLGVVGGCKLAVISEQELGVSLCGGQVGSSGLKMCIKESGRCITRSHEVKVQFNPPIRSGCGEYVLIGVGTQSEQAYLSHIVPVEHFNNVLQSYIYETRTVDEWDQFLSTIKAGPLDQEDIMLASIEAKEVAIDRAVSGGSISPRKRSADEMTRQRLEAEYDSLGSFVSSRMIEGGDVESANNSIEDLQNQMKFLVKKVKQTEMSQLTFPPDKTDRIVVGLRNMLGSRPLGMAPVSIMESLHNLTELIGTRAEGDESKSVMQLIKDSVGQLTVKEVETYRNQIKLCGPELSKLADGLCEAISEQIRDRFLLPDDFFGQWTTLTANPLVYGDILKTKLDVLEAKVNSIASMGLQMQSPKKPKYDLGLGGLSPRPSKSQLGLDSLSLVHNQPQVQPDSTESIEKIAAAVKVMQHEITIIKEQLDDTVIDVAGQRFNTKRELQAWLLTHAKLVPGKETLAVGETDIHILFPDALALYGLASQDFDESKGMAFKVQSKKAGFKTTNDALFMRSFEGALPAVFGTTRTDTRVLPLAKSAEAYDCGNAHQSYKTRLLKVVNKQAAFLTAQARSRLSYEAAPVALDCIASAAAFILELMNWMTVTSIAMTVEHGTDTKADNWLFISHSVNAIFEKLAEERSEGYGAVHNHEIIWACFKGRKTQLALSGRQISGHEIVTDVLNQHLQSSAVMKSEYQRGVKEMTRQMGELKKEMELVSKRANQALTAAQKR